MSAVKEITKREQLLLRWSEVAPDECRFVGAVWAFGVMPRGRTLTYLAAHHNDDALLGALIESLTARGWDYQIKGTVIDSHTKRADVSEGTVKHHATVWRWLGDRGSAFDGVADTSADALLSAYCSALYNEGGGERTR